MTNEIVSESGKNMVMKSKQTDPPDFLLIEASDEETREHTSVCDRVDEELNEE